MAKIDAEELLAVASGQMRLLSTICSGLEYLLLTLTTNIINKLKV